ncbi:MAG: DUF624 domain-containing protein [Lawsonibacter sp.]|nr:DUF624 domain-containing protein [Lawsonibacter sp.]
MFNPNNGFFRTLSRMVDFVGLSLLWLMLCLPVLTAGPATAALYHTAAVGLRQGDDWIFGRFCRSLWENLLQGLLITALCLPLAGALTFGFLVMLAHGNTPLGTVLWVAYTVVLLLPAGVVCWLFALLGRFSFPTSALFRTAVQLTAAHLPATLAAVALVGVAALLSRMFLGLAFVLPAVTAVLVSFPMERVFTQHME